MASLHQHWCGTASHTLHAGTRLKGPSLGCQTCTGVLLYYLREAMFVKGSRVEQITSTLLRVKLCITCYTVDC